MHATWIVSIFVLFVHAKNVYQHYCVCESFRVCNVLCCKLIIEQGGVKMVFKGLGCLKRGLKSSSLSSCESWFQRITSQESTIQNFKSFKFDSNENIENHYMNSSS
jgi:hypothetical protein